MTAKKKSWSNNPLSHDTGHDDAGLMGQGPVLQGPTMPPAPASIVAQVATSAAASAPSMPGSVAAAVLPFTGNPPPPPPPSAPVKATATVEATAAPLAAATQKVAPLAAPTPSDGSISKVYQHWADGDTATGSKAEWNNNILSANKSDYSEGEVIPHLFAYTASNNAPLVNGQTYSFNITYNYYQTNTNAGGFTGLTTFDLSRSPTNWPVGGTPSGDSTFVNNGGTAGMFYTVGADITKVSAVTYTSSNNKDGHVTVTFVYTGPTTTKGSAEIYYGLQIAGPGDVPPQQGTTPTNGAHLWTGGSLQTTVDIGGSGATSIQLSPAAILVPELTIDKTVIGVYESDGVTLDSDGIADEAGDIIKYNVLVTNTGEVQLTGVTVKDPLTGQDISGVTLAIGASANYASQYTVTQNDLDTKGGGDGCIDNTAIADSNQTDPVSDSECVPVQYNPMLDIAKQFLGFSGGNGNTVGDWAGDVLSYKVTVTNTGNITLTGVTIKDPLTGQNISGVTLIPGESKAYDSQYILTQEDLDTRGGGDMDIDNTATADSNETDAKSASAEAPLTFVPSIAIDKVFTGVTGGNGNALADFAGDVLNYKVYVTNTDSVTLTGVTVKDPLTGQDISGVSIAAGQTVVFESSYVLKQSDLDDKGGGDGDIDNTATADSDQTGPVSDSETVPLVYAPLMALYKDVDFTDGGNGNAATDSAGDVIHYNVAVQNDGNITLTGITLVDPRTGLNISGLSLAPGETKVYQTTYTLTQEDLDNNGGGDGDIDNTATADSAETDPLEASAAEPVIQRPLLSLDKHVVGVSGGNGNTVADAVDDVINYTLTVNNLGNITLTNVSVLDPLTGTDKVLASLAPGSSYVWDASYTLTQNDLDAAFAGLGQIDNLAEAWSDQTPMVTDDEAVPLLGEAVLYIDKAATGVSGGNGNAFADFAGDVLNFAVTVANQGNVTLTNVTVKDPFSGIDDLIASLLPGETKVYNSSYTLTQDDINNNGTGGSGAIVDTATADSDQTVSNSDSESIMLIRYPILALNKVFTGVTGGNGNLIADAVGDQLNYSFTVVNAGNVTLTDVSVVDPRTGFSQTGLTLAPGTVQNFSANYVLTQGDLDSNGDGDGYIDDTATADSAQTPAVSDTESVPIVQRTGLAFNKSFTGVTGGNGNALADAAGDVVNFSFTLTNPGNVTLTDVSIVDALTGTNLTGLSVAPGATQVYTGSYTLTQVDLDGRGGGDGLLDNVAAADSAQTAEVVDGEMVPLVYNPLIDLTKLVSTDNGVSWEDANAPTGPTLLSDAGFGPLFKFVVSNIGNVTLTGVEVNDSAYDLDPGAGNAHSFGDLAVGQTKEWVFDGATFAAGQQTDIATVTVTGVPGLTDVDNAYYVGVLAA